MIDPAIQAALKIPHITRKNDRDDYETPVDLVIRLNRVFHFTHDMAATKENAILNCAYFADTLAAIVTGYSPLWALDGSLWCNPPFSNKEEFFKQGIAARNYNRVTVFLAPNNARETAWWYEYALLADEIVTLAPRVIYCLNKKTVQGVTFGSCLLIYYPRLPDIETRPRESFWRWKNENIIRNR